MPSDRKPSSFLPVAGVAMLLALAAYVGAYYMMVRPVLKPLAPKREVIPWYQGKSGSEATYRRWATFFAPIHWLDRRLRPDYWR